MRELPMVPAGPPTCPAASKIQGSSGEQEGIVCRVMKREHELTDPSGMTAGDYGFTVREATGGIYLNVETDPTSVQRFCHGEAPPVLDDRDGHQRDSYTYCPIWQAEKDRIFDGRRSALREAEPEQVSMGVDSLASDDPWSAARSDLDLLAPPRLG